MNVFRFEVRQYRGALLAWALGLSGVMLLYLSFMPAFMSEIETLRAFFQGLGGALLKAMGVDVAHFVSPMGYFCFSYTIVTFLAAVQALHMGLSILSKESRMRATDFLLTKPRRRGVFFAGKALAACCVLLATQAAVCAAAGIGLWSYMRQGFLFSVFARVALSMSFVQLTFLTLGLCVAAWKPRMKSVITTALAVAMGLFLIGMVAGLTGSVILRVLSPLRYFDYNYILANGRYEMGYLLLSLGLSIALCAAAYGRYTRTDVYIG